MYGPKPKLGRRKPVKPSSEAETILATCRRCPVDPTHLLTASRGSVAVASCPSQLVSLPAPQSPLHSPSSAPAAAALLTAELARPRYQDADRLLSLRPGDALVHPPLSISLNAGCTILATFFFPHTTIRVNSKALSRISRPAAL
jgi:hypothetical protein